MTTLCPSDLTATIAAARTARKSLLSPLAVAIEAAHEALHSARKVGEAQPGGSAPVAAGGAPDPSTTPAPGTLTTEAFAGAGKLPPGIGVPRRRRHLAQKGDLSGGGTTNDRVGTPPSGVPTLAIWTGVEQATPAATSFAEGGVDLVGQREPKMVNGAPISEEETYRSKAALTYGPPLSAADMQATANGTTLAADPGAQPFVTAPVQPLDAIPDPILTTYEGLEIVIDRPVGFVQTKLNPDGSVAWTRTYTCNYGFLPATTGGDAEELDVFLTGPIGDGDENESCEMVYWFVILNDAGQFDEYKLVVGAKDAERARKIILAHIPPQFVAPEHAVTTIAQIRALLGQDPIERESALAIVSKSLDAIEPNAKRMAALKSALKSVSGPEYQGAKPLPADLAQHPALTDAPTNTYSNPDDVGGWVYVIDGDAWIAFVGVDGKALLWTERDENGGVVGVPYEFRRNDLSKPDAQGRYPLVGLTAPVATKQSAKSLQVTIKAASDTELRCVTGIVLEPEVADAQGEIYSAEVIRQSAWEWTSYFANFDVQHKVYVPNTKIRVVESWIAPLDYWIDSKGEACPSDTGGCQLVRKGTWIVSAVIDDLSLWAAVKRGELTGWSMNGMSRGEPV